MSSKSSHTYSLDTLAAGGILQIVFKGWTRTQDMGGTPKGFGSPAGDGVMAVFGPFFAPITEFILRSRQEGGGQEWVQVTVGGQDLCRMPRT